MTQLPSDIHHLYTSTLIIGISSNYPGGGIGFTLATNKENETQLVPEAQEELATGPPTVVGVFFFLINYILIATRGA
jgi:hypothetical protein